MGLGGHLAAKSDREHFQRLWTGKTHFMKCNRGVFCYAQTCLALFPWRSGRNARYFPPLGIDCGREFIHLFEEHRDFPDLLVLQRGGKARHRREADSMLHLPKRRGLGIIFDSIFGKLRCVDIEALSKVRRLGIRCAMAYRAIFRI